MRSPALLAVLLAACTGYGISDNPGVDGAAADLSGDLGPGPTAYDGGGLPHRQCGAPLQEGPLPPVVAIWDGYSDQPQKSGSDAVHLVLRSDGTNLSGNVVFGSTAALPPEPTDSTSCYPYPSDSPVWQDFTSTMVEGFSYPLAPGGTMSDVRLNLKLVTLAPLADWCACQVPVVFSDEGGWGCAPNTGEKVTPDGHCYLTQFNDTPDIEVPCCNPSLCVHDLDCTCDETSCSIDLNQQLTLDLSVNGTHADGSGVHLTRTQ